jgi:plasmid stability protein
MANRLVRNLDDDVLRQVKAAAKSYGRSRQAEIHDVLRNARLAAWPKRDVCPTGG